MGFRFMIYNSSNWQICKTFTCAHFRWLQIGRCSIRHILLLARWVLNVNTHIQLNDKSPGWISTMVTTFVVNFVRPKLNEICRAGRVCRHIYIIKTRQKTHLVHKLSISINKFTYHQVFLLYHMIYYTISSNCFSITSRIEILKQIGIIIQNNYLLFEREEELNIKMTCVVRLCCLCC